MWEPVALPFMNDATPTLPTADEIRTCPNVLSKRCTSKVVAFNDKIVVKFGGGVSIREGQALIYLQRHVPDIPAPRLYAMYEDSEELFLVMERAPGVQLESMWPLMTESEKDAITEKLRGIFDSMRQAECPLPSFYGGVDGGTVQHYLLYSQKGDGEQLGPFYDEAAFVASLVGNFRALVERNARPDFKCRHYETHLGSVLREFRPTLTHSDVHKTNIIVSEIQGEKGERDFNVVLVDWEMAGWYPDFWEFFCTSSSFDYVYWEEDWCWRVEQFLQVFPAKAAMMRMLDKDMRF